MDNKQNRQFYWEVKDFLGKKQPIAESVKSTKHSLIESVSGILNSGNHLHSPQNNQIEIYEDFINSLDNRTVKSVNNLLSTHRQASQSETPESIAFGKNITENLFTVSKKSFLSERVAQDLSGSFSPMATSASKKKNEDEEEEEGVASFSAPPNAGAVGSAFNAPRMIPPTAPGSQQAPSMISSPPKQKSGADIIQDLRTARSISASGPGGRAGRNAAIAMANIAAQRERERLQDEGKQARRERDAAKKAISVEVEGPAAPGAATPTAVEVGTEGAKNLAAKEAAYREKMDVLRTFNDRSGYNQPSPQFGSSTQASVGARYARKPGEVVAMPDDTIIQGTSMTYGEFKRQTGRNYNALNKDDSSLVSRLAGAGRYGSEQARQTALSADQMNQAYAAQNTQLAQQYGQAERQMDKSQMELDRYRNTPSAERVQQTISTTQTPEMIAKIADEMKQKNLQAQETKDRTYGGDMRASSTGVARASVGPFNVGGMMTPEKAAAANAAQSGRFMTGQPLELTQQTPEQIAKLNPPSTPSPYPSLISSFVSQNIPGSIAPGGRKNIENQLKRLKGQ